MRPAAEFCPESIHLARRQDARFRAEVEFYDALARQLPAGWHVFYSVGWLNRDAHGALRDGEADFVLAHESHGVLTVEVKGGLVEFDGERQQWTSQDRSGRVHEIKDPFEQSKTSKHTLIGKLREQPELRGLWVGLQHAVAFPDTPRSSTGGNLTADPRLVIWRDDMLRLPERLEEISRYSYGSEAFQSGKQILLALRRLIGRTVKVANPLRIQLDNESRDIQSLTDTQIDAMAIIQRVRRVAMSGGAGSGKTYIAVHRARQLASEGFRTLFTCRSKPLASFLGRLFAGTSNLDVLHAEDLARRYAPTLAANAPELELAEGLFDAATSLPERPYDAIFVDEGQDFTPAWWTALEALLAEGRESVFFVCHDSNNQAVHREAGGMPTDLAPICLEENVRNTTDICEALLPHYRGDVKIRPRMSKGRSVEYRTYAAGELQDALGTVLSRLLVTEGLLAKDIVVLTPRDRATSELGRLALPSGIRLTNEEGNARGRTVLWANVADFKGLERPIVVVAELDDQLTTDQRERDAILYVAYSRSRSLLIVLHTEKVESYIRPNR